MGCRTIALESCAAAGFTPREAHTADHYEAVFALVRAGLGVALAPRLGLSRPDPEMVVQELRAEQPRRQVVLYARRAGDRAPHLRSVVRALERTAASFSSAT